MKDDIKLIKTKADLLCNGLQRNNIAERIFKTQNPYEDIKTGNIGIHIWVDRRTHILVSVTHRFDEYSPYVLKENNKKIFLYKNNTQLYEVNSIQIPKWYSKTTSSKKIMSKFFLYEGEKYLHQAYQGCGLHKNGVGCKFCGTGNIRKVGTPQEIAEIVDNAYQERQDIHICLGGGVIVTDGTTPLIPDKHYIEYFHNCALLIRKKIKNIPIWVEMLPPLSDDEIDMLIEAGVTSFGFNLEIWNSDLRKQICPGKSIIPRERYLKALEYCTKVLGKNKVGCAFIVGLQPIEDLMKGIKELVKIEVQPCLIPFKPWDTSKFSNKKPCKPDELFTISTFAVAEMLKFNINPKENQGCLHCDSCTLEHDIYRMN